MMTDVLPAIFSCLGSAAAYGRALVLRVFGMDVGSASRIAWTAHIEATNPRGVHIGAGTEIGPGADLSAYDSANDLNVELWIGERCHIGRGAVIYPGVRIGDGSIVAPGAVVAADVPDNCFVVGHPARAVEKNIRTGRYGARLDGGPLPEERVQPVQGLGARASGAPDRVGALS
jgi:acetyltransferase-like isoleucine patch superfamily enzyme